MRLYQICFAFFIRQTVSGNPNQNPGKIQTFDSKNAKLVRIFAYQQPLASENDLKGCSEETSSGMLLYRVKRKV